ncbi:MAG: nitroreductase, partial [Verrucomicrobia bacterium]|nr:nitroreductase [Verrucomicrobiota bacterium]
MKTLAAHRECEAWEVSEGGFPNGGTVREKLLFALRYAILAPSSHNTQPWLFRVRGDAVEMLANRTRGLRVSDPDDRELTISCGAALFHLRVALAHFGCAGRVQILPEAGEPDLLVRARLEDEQKASLEDELLFHALPKRRTNRRPFRDEAVPETLLCALQTAAEQEGAWLHLVRSEQERYALADLVAEADRLQWADPDFRRELAAWALSNRSDRRDGIPGYANGQGDLMSLAGPLVIRTFDLGEGRAAKDRDIALYSPALAVLWNAADTPAAWLHAGQALARVLL